MECVVCKEKINPLATDELEDGFCNECGNTYIDRILYDEFYDKAKDIFLECVDDGEFD